LHRKGQIGDTEHQRREDIPPFAKVWSADALITLDITIHELVHPSCSGTSTADAVRASQEYHDHHYCSSSMCFPGVQEVCTSSGHFSFFFFEEWQEILLEILNVG
jgi:hypothetical protein